MNLYEKFFPFGVLGFDKNTHSPNHAKTLIIVLCALLSLVVIVIACNHNGAADTSTLNNDSTVIIDSIGRKVAVPRQVERIICSGSGCLRLVTYLNCQDRVVAVDNLETRQQTLDARPYAMANSQFKKMPVFGEFRGHDNPELILALKSTPQVILKTGIPGLGCEPQELQDKTGIPVVMLNYGNLNLEKSELFKTLRTMGEVLGVQARAENVIKFFETQIQDLNQRTLNIPAKDRPSVFVGGIAMAGPHGYQSTDPNYAPFAFVNAKNLVSLEKVALNRCRHANIAKEKIIEWDPDFLFLDLSTLQMGDSAGGFFELKNDPVYRSLSAVKKDKVYGLLPCKWYNTNYSSILANSFFIGKLLYPDQFTDVDPAIKADEIYTFLVGKPIFNDISGLFKGLAYKPIPVN